MKKWALTFSYLGDFWWSRIWSSVTFAFGLWKTKNYKYSYAYNFVSFSGLMSIPLYYEKTSMIWLETWMFPKWKDQSWQASFLIGDRVNLLCLLIQALRLFSCHWDSQLNNCAAQPENFNARPTLDTVTPSKLSVFQLNFPLRTGEKVKLLF